MEYNIPYPYIGRRKSVQPYELHRGSVVAFKTRDRKPRTGIIIMDDRTMMMAAVNLYKEEGRIWYLEDIPDDIDLFESNKEERLWGYKFFLEEQCRQCKAYEGKDPFVAFIENECPQGDNAWGQTAFCQDFLSYVPKMLDKTEWQSLKQLLWQAIVQSGGLQFNRYSTEYYCYLIGVLMIAENGISDFTYYPRIEQFKKEWYQLSWMYGMAIGRVTGTALNNFTAVVKQAGQGRRKHYLHLYLPLVENNIDKICSYKTDNRYKLQEAIRLMREQEALAEQKTDLDELYHILFPKHFVLAMADSRPAATIADLKEKLAERDQIISKLQTDIDNVSNQYKKVLEQLKNAVAEVENDKISGEDLTASFLRFPTELALSYFGTMSSLFALNPTWQKYSPRIMELILAKQKEQQDKQEQKQDKLADAVEKAANKPTNQFTVYSQPGSTANLGCDQKNSDFKTYLPKADGSEEQSMLESNKKGEEDVKIIK